MFAIFLFRQFFIGIPRELFEAARVDGASFRVLERSEFIALTVVQHVHPIAVLEIILIDAADQRPAKNGQGLVHDCDEDIDIRETAKRDRLALERRPGMIGKQQNLHKCVSLRRIDRPTHQQAHPIAGIQGVEASPQQVPRIEK